MFLGRLWAVVFEVEVKGVDTRKKNPLSDDERG
jgi:hypothetical protein